LKIWFSFVLILLYASDLDMPNWRALLMPASIYTSLRSFPASGLRLLRESHAFCTNLTLSRRNCCRVTRIFFADSTDSDCQVWP